MRIVNLLQNPDMVIFPNSDGGCSIFSHTIHSNNRRFLIRGREKCRSSMRNVMFRHIQLISHSQSSNSFPQHLMNPHLPIDEGFQRKIQQIFTVLPGILQILHKPTHSQERIVIIDHSLQIIRLYLPFLQTVVYGMHRYGRIVFFSCKPLLLCCCNDFPIFY